MNAVRNSITGKRRKTLSGPFFAAMNSCPRSTRFRVVLPWDYKLQTFSLVPYNANNEIQQTLSRESINRLRDLLAKSKFRNPSSGMLKLYLALSLCSVIFGILTIVIYEYWIKHIQAGENGVRYFNWSYAGVGILMICLTALYVFKYAKKRRLLNLKKREGDFRRIVKQFNLVLVKQSITIRVGKYGSYLSIIHQHLWKDEIDLEAETIQERTEYPQLDSRNFDSERRDTKNFTQNQIDSIAY